VALLLLRKKAHNSLIPDLIPGIRAECSQFVRHQNLYFSSRFLRSRGIDFTEIAQVPGDMLILFPFTYHQGYNMGANIAIANNYVVEGEGHVYETGYVPCRDECHVGQPLVLRFPLKDYCVPGRRGAGIGEGNGEQEGSAEGP
jgi:hypothetical protein